jgi:hypothetical protein
MSGFEQTLQQHAIYKPDNIYIAPIADILADHGLKLKQLSSGLQARVYKIKHHDWVVKEGRWDLDIALFHDVKLPLPSKLTQDFLNLFSYSFHPTPTVIKQQYQHYLEFVQYFGHFRSSKYRADHKYHHPDVEEIALKQHTFRSDLAETIPEIEYVYSIRLPERVKQILTSSIRFHNFLPKEYLLMGKSLRGKYKDKLTYFIFQKFVKGSLLHDEPLENLPQKYRSQVLLLAYLILLMHYKRGLVPDTRPRYPLTEVFDWLTKTDNIIVSENGLKFIDTRWMWETKGNFVQRGLIIPDMVVNLAKRTLLML